eukprot:TRINITY_DN59_c2_g1_i2.p2 TRINITY_DN59_c2_g1~~TRINITY_DN59_c2_g1_i2.p2  ORF type:complete len:113 (-),score=45.64 TRINITY_DN59_c2_g1_i2:83-421(-)
MRYVAAYLLATLGGNASPQAADLNNILGSAGISVNAEEQAQFLATVSGKDLAQIIKDGTAKLATVPALGGGGAAPAAAASAGPAAAAPAAKEEKKEEPKEESDGDMGFGLFD